tara:strand:- start:384563 stop:384781 length:219 start_codon:yes stop_codon:yes gene_type:complete
VKEDKDISVTRAVGRFFGHIWGATTKPVSTDEPASRIEVVSHDVEESQSAVDNKKVILRRTTIDEVEIQEDK